ncbi:MAG: sugar phosphate isomerase/epimerase family protein [Vampirovibrionia bacterium]
MEILIACKEAPLLECIDFANTNNLGIEINSFSSPLTFQSDWHGLLEIIKRQLKVFNGFKALHGISCQGPHRWDRFYVQELKKTLEKCLTIAEELETKAVIYHSMYMPGLTFWKYKDWHECQVDLWGHVSQKAQEKEIVIAIENIVDENPKNIFDVIKDINLSNLKCCLDFGHINLIASNIPPTEWIESLEPYLYSVHCHNNNGRYDSHNSLENGTIEYKEIIEKLIECKAPPKIAIETFNLEYAKTSLDMINTIIKEKQPIS